MVVLNSPVVAGRDEYMLVPVTVHVLVGEDEYEILLMLALADQNFSQEAKHSSTLTFPGMAVAEAVAVNGIVTFTTMVELGYGWIVVLPTSTSPSARRVAV